MSEKLDWEKWSAFSTQNRYVAEAERYSRPGSVAQKKAFFEAHYKKLAAARKAAAEEALLLEQQNSKSEPEKLPVQEDINGGGKKDGLVSKPDLEIPRDAKMKSLAEKVSRFGDTQSDEKENRGKAETEINGKDSTCKEEQVEEKTPMILKVIFRIMIIQVFFLSPSLASSFVLHLLLVCRRNPKIHNQRAVPNQEPLSTTHRRGLQVKRQGARATLTLSHLQKSLID